MFYPLAAGEEKIEMRRCALIKAGRLEYDEGLILQGKARTAVSSGIWDGVFILLEHTPEYTIGRSGGKDNSKEDASILQAEGVQITAATRGGNVTCHNPGQIVGYPVLDLTKWRQDVHWYVDMLEEVIIETLATFGLRTGRKAKYTGVWLKNEKITAIGIAVKHWITYHGFALNVVNDLSLFSKIVPCGITEFGVTSLKKAGGVANREEVAAILIKKFSKVFACTLQETVFENMADVVKI